MRVGFFYVRACLSKFGTMLRFWEEIGFETVEEVGSSKGYLSFLTDCIANPLILVGGDIVDGVGNADQLEKYLERALCSLHLFTDVN